MVVPYLDHCVLSFKVASCTPRCVPTVHDHPANLGSSYLSQDQIFTISLELVHWCDKLHEMEDACSRLGTHGTRSTYLDLNSADTVPTINRLTALCHEVDCASQIPNLTLVSTSDTNDSSLCDHDRSVPHINIRLSSIIRVDSKRL